MYRLLSAFALTAVLTAPTSPDDRGRPVILLIHGRGLLDRDTAGLRRLWYDGLTTGSKALAAASPITERDVRLVWYADVLDPRSDAGCSYTADDRRARRDAAVDSNLKSVVSIVGGFLSAISSMTSDSESGAGLRTLAADASFLGDVRKRCASEQRLADALEQARRDGRPVILVAHSLGSLVAYDYLSTRSDSGVVRRLVSVGSMVGSSEMRRLLIGGDSTDTLALPKSVTSWINVRNDGDALAAPLSIAREIMITSAPGETDAHEMVGYLRNGATAGAVVSGWCAAFASKPPPGCAAIMKAAP